MLADLDTPFLTAFFCTTVVGSVFLGMSLSYTSKRTNKHYAEGKSAAPSIRVFKNLSKLLFIVSMTFTLAGYWIESAWLFPLLDASSVFQLTGAMLVLAGYIGLVHAFKRLGENYSPLFDAFLPASLVINGIYRYIRHPVYLFNLFVSFGLALSSASAVVLTSALIGMVYVLKAIAIEEEYLIEHFPEYTDYMKQSWRLIPLFY